MRRWRAADFRPQSLRGFVIAALCLAILIPLGLVLFAWSGIYNVAASAGHLPPTRALLTLGLRGSVRTHSIGIEAPPLDDPDLIRLGAGHYAGGCAPCHGAPGTPINRITSRMLPPPPDMATAVDDWEEEELFWIVKHGIKYTGMPAWVAQTRDDEVWAVVAFLRRLPGLSPGDYGDLANLPAAAGTSAKPRDYAVFSEMLTLCARCHGDGDSRPTSALVPRLSGQSVRYMSDALRSYAEGSRYSGIMEPIAAELDDGSIESLAAHYSALAQGSAATRREPSDPDAVERGRSIATDGIPSAEIPACLSCHGEGASDEFPRLIGQHGPYIATQLRAFRTGRRGGTAGNDIMEAIAGHLTEGQIADVSAFLGSFEGDSLAAGLEDGAGGEP